MISVFDECFSKFGFKNEMLDIEISDHITMIMGDKESFSRFADTIHKNDETDGCDVLTKFLFEKDIDSHLLRFGMHSNMEQEMLRDIMQDLSLEGDISDLVSTIQLLQFHDGMKEIITAYEAEFNTTPIDSNRRDRSNF